MNKYLYYSLIIIIALIIFDYFSIEKMTTINSNYNSDDFYVNFLAFINKIKNQNITLTNVLYQEYAKYLIDNKNQNIDLAKIDTFKYIARSAAHDKLTLDCLKTIGKEGIKSNPCNIPN